MDRKRLYIRKINLKKKIGEILYIVKKINEPSEIYDYKKHIFKKYGEEFYCIIINTDYSNFYMSPNYYYANFDWKIISPFKCLNLYYFLYDNGYLIGFKNEIDAFNFVSWIESLDVMEKLNRSN